MLINVMKSKIHRATVTQADLDYVGSITIDSNLMKNSGIYENERVQICNVTNGNRLETYVISGEANSGIICINGAAAHLVNPGDMVIIIAYGMIDEKDISNHKSKVVFVDKGNKIVEIIDKEKHGEIKNY